MTDGDGIKWIVIGVLAWWALTKVGFGKGDFLASIRQTYSSSTPVRDNVMPTPWR